MKLILFLWLVVLYLSETTLAAPKPSLGKTTIAENSASEEDENLNSSPAFSQTPPTYNPYNPPLVAYPLYGENGGSFANQNYPNQGNIPVNSGYPQPGPPLPMFRPYPTGRMNSNQENGVNTGYPQYAFNPMYQSYPTNQLNSMYGSGVPVYILGYPNYNNWNSRPMWYGNGGYSNMYPALSQKK